jgi:hypothetical protein
MCHTKHYAAPCACTRPDCKRKDEACCKKGATIGGWTLLGGSHLKDDCYQTEKPCLDIHQAQDRRDIMTKRCRNVKTELRLKYGDPYPFCKVCPHSCKREPVIHLAAPLNTVETWSSPRAS